VVKVRHLDKAPAREALIDIQFAPAVPLSVVDRFVADALPSFGKRSDLMHPLVGLGGGPVPTQSPGAVIGRRLDSSDPPHVLQCRATGFTFSRLSPYGQWSDLRLVAKEWWDKYCAVAQPEVVTRIAVRYVNRIHLPLPVDDFSKYLVFPPRIPEGLPQVVSGFFHRTIIPNDEKECTIVVTQALEGLPAQIGGVPKIPFLFDIDVYRDKRIDQGRLDDVWEGLDVLREQKNLVFFEYLTESAMELFK